VATDDTLGADGTAGADDASSAGAETTVAARRAPDGSRHTAHPNGPAYHEQDGTVHLVVWDEPCPGACVVLSDEDESADWGGGPDIHLYDRMERPDAEAGDGSATDTARIDIEDSTEGDR